MENSRHLFEGDDLTELRSFHSAPDFYMFNVLLNEQAKLIFKAISQFQNLEITTSKHFQLRNLSHFKIITIIENTFSPEE